MTILIVNSIELYLVLAHRVLGAELAVVLVSLGPDRGDDGDDCEVDNDDHGDEVKCGLVIL